MFLLLHLLSIISLKEKSFFARIGRISFTTNYTAGNSNSWLQCFGDLCLNIECRSNHGAN